MSKNSNLRIAVGTNNFKKMVIEHDVFVDKTLFIKEVIDSSEEAILITYPRRWGKTLNLDMLKTFLSVEVDENGNTVNTNSNQMLFQGGQVSIGYTKEKQLAPLAIAKVDGGSYIKEYQGKYPVIFISLKDVVAHSVGELRDKLKSLVKFLYREYRYLANSSKLAEDEKIDFGRYIAQDYEKVILEDSIKFLSTLLHKHHGQKVYVLVDEYDKPMNSLLEEYMLQEKILERDKLIKDVAELITQTTCSSVAKTNPHVEKLVFVGIFDILQKESGFGCNNVKSFCISDQKFSRSFGFSKEEVGDLVTKFSFDDPKNVLDKIKDWYNGYSVPTSTGEYMEVYTPWAVMNYLNDVQSIGTGLNPRGYWTQSGASTILQTLLKKEACVDSELSRKLQSIVVQNSIQLDFDQHISLLKYDIKNALNNEKVFSYLLVNSGYLTVKRVNEKYNFSIPNFELMQGFEDVIKNQINHKDCSNYQVMLDHLHKKAYSDAVKAIAANDKGSLQDIFSKNSQMKCSDVSLNFNYFEIAALLKDDELFKILLDKCDRKQLLERDQTSKFGVADYAFMGNNTQIFDLLTAEEKTDKSIVQPSAAEEFFCRWAMYVVVGFAVVLPVAIQILLTNIGDRELVESGLPKLGAVFWWGIAVIKSYEVGAWISGVCDDCTAYSEIDISNPKNFKNLIQFEKYVLEHEGFSYVTLNNQCNDNYHKKIADIAIPIFSHSFYGIDEINFALCEINNSVQTDL